MLTPQKVRLHPATDLEAGTRYPDETGVWCGVSGRLNLGDGGVLGV